MLFTMTSAVSIAFEDRYLIPSELSYLNKLNEVLGQLVVSQILLKAPYSKVSDHWIWIITI